MSDPTTVPTGRRPLMFSYWGRRGALSQFTIELARAAMSSTLVSPTISVSRQNEAFASFSTFGPALFPVETFSASAGAALAAWRIPRLRRGLVSRLSADACDAVVELMPHVWSPLVMPAAKLAGVRYISIIHDAEAHPGDRTGLVNDWLLRTCRHADRVVTLSRSVTDILLRKGLVTEAKVATLFHPNLTYSPMRATMPREPGAPIRLMFLGRIMPYKGLTLFTEMAERLRNGGMRVEFGVFGSGDMAMDRPRLERLGAEIVNRWLSEADIADALSRYDAVVVSHIEASQSGVIAAAHGAGRPVIVTPVGGLIEQVRHCVTGMVAERPNAAALADAAMLLAADGRLYDSIVDNIRAESAGRSMERFLEHLVGLASPSRAPTAENAASG